MLRSIFWYISFIISLMARTPARWKAQSILKTQGQEAFDRYAYGVTTRWAAARLRQSRANITVHNKERIPMDRNVLFVSNHQSDFDIAIFMGLIGKDAGFVAKSEMENIPFLSKWMQAIHCVFMDRKDMKKSLQTILDGIKILKAGYSLVVFPEGTRSKCDKMGDFRMGSFKLATKSKVPIVPVTMDGSFHIMEGNRYLIKPANVSVFVHEPIFLEGMSKEELAGLGECVKEIILEPIRDKQ